MALAVAPEATPQEWGWKASLPTQPRWPFRPLLLTQTWVPSYPGDSDITTLSFCSKATPTGDCSRAPPCEFGEPRLVAGTTLRLRSLVPSMCSVRNKSSFPSSSLTPRQTHRGLPRSLGYTRGDRGP